MRTKTFLFYSIFYIGIVGIFVFAQNSASYTLSVLDLSLTLPVAVWFVLPLALFALLCTLHMMATGMGLYFKRKALDDDKHTYIEITKNALLGNIVNKTLKTDYYKIPVEITKILSPTLKNSDNKDYLRLDDENLRSIIADLEDIKEGKFKDLKKFHLSKDNPIYIKNEINHIKADPNYALELIKSKTPLDEEVQKVAHKSVIEHASFNDIKKFQMPNCKKCTLKLIDRYINEKNFDISQDDFLLLLDGKEFSGDDYINIAKKLEGKMSPEELIGIFDRLKNSNYEAIDGYFYVLYAFGMIDELKEKLQSLEVSKDNRFNVLLFLKEQGKNVPIDLFTK